MRRLDHGNRIILIFHKISSTVKHFWKLALRTRLFSTRLNLLPLLSAWMILSLSLATKVPVHAGTAMVATASLISPFSS